MGDVKISALPSASSANSTDILPADQSGTTRGVTVAQLQTAVFTTPVQSSYEDFTAIADPSAPSSGHVRIYGKQVAGRILPKWIGPSGINTQFQAALDGNSVVMWLPGTSTTAAINFGTSWSITTTQATPAIAATSLMTSIKRATFTTTTTAGSGSGVRSAAPVAVYSGSTTTAGQAGFFLAMRFGVLTYTSTMRILMGMSSTTTALGSTDPSAGYADLIAITKDAADSAWQGTTSAGAGTFTKNTSGHTVAASSNTDCFDFFAFNPDDGSGHIWLRLVDIGNNTVYLNDVAASGNLPRAGALLTVQAACSNSAGGAGSAVAIWLSKIYIECDN